MMGILSAGTLQAPNGSFSQKTFAAIINLQASNRPKRRPPPFCICTLAWLAIAVNNLLESGIKWPSGGGGGGGVLSVEACQETQLKLESVKIKPARESERVSMPA